jgi:hypothetical protein
LQTKQFQPKLTVLYLARDARCICITFDGWPWFAWPTQIRMQMLASALIGKKGTPVCFFRLQRAIPRNRPDDPKAAAAFRDFAATLWNRLEIPAHLVDND